MTCVSNDFAVATRIVNFADFLAGEPNLRIRDERAADFSAREKLLDGCFGTARREKTSERLREGRLPAAGLALAAVEGGRLVGTLRLWHVDVGSAACPALLLGPLAVAPCRRSQGLGTLLICEALRRASVRGYNGVLLVGDLAYYGRFGFSRQLTTMLDLPEPVDRARFLGLELEAGALARAKGMVRAAGAFEVAALAA